MHVHAPTSLLTGKLFLYFQLLQFLEKVGMSQYKEVFQTECLTGDILVECDEETLQEDLGVHSRIHLIKFKKLISGTYCIEDFLSADAQP